MNRERSSLDEIDRRLRRAARLLEGTAGKISAVGFSPNVYVRKIGEALVSIFEIQHAIYRRRPDLMPAFLKKPPGGGSALPNKRLQRTTARGKSKSGASRRRDNRGGRR